VNKYVALLALGTITEGPDKETFSQVIRGVAMNLLQLFEDPSQKVREANSWVFSRICDNHADILTEENTLQGLMH